MSLEKCDLIVLVKRILLEIKTRRVDMCSAETYTVFDIFSSYNSGNDSFSAVYTVDLVTCFKLHTVCVFNEAFAF